MPVEDFFTKIIASGVTGGTMFVACWWLVKALKEQYEKRIDALEKAAEQCAADRTKLHGRIEELLIAFTTNKAPARRKAEPKDS